MNEAIATHGHVLRGWSARFYDFGNSFFGVPLVNRAHLSLLQLRPGDHLLDIGCGTGQVIRQLLGRYGDEVTLAGVDPSPEMIAIARRRFEGRPSVRIEPGVGERLPFASGRFDWVVSCLTSHHLPLDAKRAMVEECRRVLKPGGTLLLSDFGRPTSLIGRCFAFAWRGHSYASENMEDVIPELVRQAGFLHLRAYRQAGIILHLRARRRAPVTECRGP
jgi:ubiquinone/menaquinone biosynthesis C-methylase UbiE